MKNKITHSMRKSVPLDSTCIPVESNKKTSAHATKMQYSTMFNKYFQRFSINAYTIDTTMPITHQHNKTIDTIDKVANIISCDEFKKN